MGDKRTLKRRLLDAGYPENEMYHHESDLYVRVTPVTTLIVEQWCKEHGFNREWNCPMFHDQTNGELMYDCAFQWYEEVKNHE